MAQIFYEPLVRTLTNSGAVGSGYKYYFYTTGTTTPITTYSNSTLTTPNASPVVADSNGRFGPIWVSNLSTTKAILKTDADVVVETTDPVGATASTTSLNDLDVRPTSYWGLTSGTSTAYVLTANPSISAYSNLQTFFFQPHIANGAAATIAVSSLAALNLKKYTGQGGKVALSVGDLQATQRYIAICDGVDIVIINPNTSPLYTGVAPTLTIAAGIATLTNVGSNYLLDTEGSAATDDLDTINTGVQGLVIIVGSTASARNVILKHNTGNIYNPAGFDIVLETVNQKVTLIYDSTLVKWMVLTAPSAVQILHVNCTRGNNVSDGTPGVGTNIRVLNTVLTNTIAGASLSSNQVTLPAGTFKITGKAPVSNDGNGHQAYIYNVTDSVTVLTGTNGYSGGGVANYSESFVDGILTITSSKVYELRHYIAAAGADSLGSAVNSGLNNTYAVLIVEKIG